MLKATSNEDLRWSAFWPNVNLPLTSDDVLEMRIAADQPMTAAISLARTADAEYPANTAVPIGAGDLARFVSTRAFRIYRKVPRPLDYPQQP